MCLYLKPMFPKRCCTPSPLDNYLSCWYCYNLCLTLSKSRKQKLDAGDNKAKPPPHDPRVTVMHEQPPQPPQARGLNLSVKPFPGAKPHISWQSQPFKAALSALSNLICFKSCRSHRIISGLESSENRCAALLSTHPTSPSKGLIRRQINQTSQ